MSMFFKKTQLSFDALLWLHFLFYYFNAFLENLMIWHLTQEGSFRFFTWLKRYCAFMIIYDYFCIYSKVQNVTAEPNSIIFDISVLHVSVRLRWFISAMFISYINPRETNCICKWLYNEVRLWINIMRWYSM